MTSINEIKLAYTNIRTEVNHTPVLTSRTLDNMLGAKVYFKADWQQNETHVYTRNYYQPRIDEFNYYLNFTGIPEGKHNVTFYAVQDGIYAPSLYEYYSLGKKISS